MEGEKIKSTQYLTFLIEKQIFAIPIDCVIQIVGYKGVTQIPNSKPYIKGVIDLRGTIIPIVDVRKRLNKAEQEYTDRTSIIIIKISGTMVGLIIDLVEEVVEIYENNIANPPKIAQNSTKSPLSGMSKGDGKIILILDVENILSDYELSDIDAVEGLDEGIEQSEV